MYYKHYGDISIFTNNEHVIKAAIKKLILNNNDMTYINLDEYHICIILKRHSNQILDKVIPVPVLYASSIFDTRTLLDNSGNDTSNIKGLYIGYTNNTFEEVYPITDFNIFIEDLTYSVQSNNSIVFDCINAISETIANQHIKELEDWNNT